MYFRPLMVLWSIEIPFPTKNDRRCLQNVEKPINYAKNIYIQDAMQLGLLKHKQKQIFYSIIGYCNNLE